MHAGFETPRIESITATGVRVKILGDIVHIGLVEMMKSVTLTLRAPNA